MSDMTAGAGPAEVSVESGEDPYRPSVLRNMMHMMSSQVASWILGTVAQIVQPRFLGPDGLGQLRLAFSVWLIVQVFVTLGTSPFLVLEMARDRARGSALIGPLMLLRLGTFSVASVLVAIYAVVNHLDSDMNLLLALTGSTILVMSIAETLSSALIGLEQMAYPSIANVVSKTLYTVVMVVVLVLGGGVIGVALTTGFNAVLTLGLLWYFYRRFGSVTWRQPPGGLLAAVRSSSGFLVASAVIVVYLQVDTVVIALLVDDTALGWYATADVLSSSLLFVPAILMGTLFPVIGRLHASDVEAAANVVRRAFSALFLAGVALGFGTLVVAQPVCVLLFGEKFRESGPILAVLGAVMPLFFCTLLLGTVAMATGRQKFWNTLMIGATILSVALDFVFIPWMERVANNGAIGGALSYAATEAVMIAIGIRVIAPGTFAGESGQRIVKVLVAGAAMIGAAWPLRNTFILIPVVVGAVVFIAFVAVLGILIPEERQLLQRTMQRFGLRSSSEAVPELDGGVDQADMSSNVESSDERKGSP